MSFDALTLRPSYHDPCHSEKTTVTSSFRVRMGVCLRIQNECFRLRCQRVNSLRTRWGHGRSSGIATLPLASFRGQRCGLICAQCCGDAGPGAHARYREASRSAAGSFGFAGKRSGCALRPHSLMRDRKNDRDSWMRSSWPWRAFRIEHRRWSPPGLAERRRARAE